MNDNRGSWPTPNYMVAWKTFRRLSNEPAITASHIVSLPGWPTKEKVRILDIGCGDGRMLEAFFLEIPQEVAAVILLDPDEFLLNESASVIRNLGLATKIRTQVGVADQEAIRLARDADVGLAIHLVYLLAHTRFRTLVDRWPPGIPLYVVLDAPESVFSELWALTAPDYATRSARVHQYLSQEANGSLDICRTDFETRVTNPFELPEPDQTLVLSLLSYSDYNELPPKSQMEVERIIQSHVLNGQIGCSCTCYEISRNSR